MSGFRQNQLSALKGQRAPHMDALTGRLTDRPILPVASSADVAIIESGNPQELSLSSAPKCAKIEFNGASQPMTLYGYVDGKNISDQNYLFDAVVRGHAVSGEVMTPIGGLVPRGVLIAGHQGVSKTLRCTPTPGSMVKIPYNGSSFDFAMIVVPKYFPSTETAGLKEYVIYTKNADGSVTAKVLSSALWNEGGTNLIGFAYAYLAASNPGEYSYLYPNRRSKAMCAAHFGNAPTSSTNEQQPKLVFYGSLRPGAAGATRTRCPIARNATAVKLVGGGTQVNTARLTMSQFYDPATYDPATVVGSVGPQASYTTVPLVAEGEGYIEVTSLDAIGGTLDIPFELHYYLGV